MSALTFSSLSMNINHNMQMLAFIHKNKIVNTEHPCHWLNESMVSIFSQIYFSASLISSLCQKSLSCTHYAYHETASKRHVTTEKQQKLTVFIHLTFGRMRPLNFQALVVICY